MAGMVMVLTVIFQNCGVSSSAKVITSSVSQVTPQSVEGCPTCVYNKINWETTGSGDLAFNMTLLPDQGGFAIEVYRYQQKTKNTMLTLSSTDQAALVAALLLVYQGTLTVNSQTTNAVGPSSTLTLYSLYGAQSSIQAPFVQSNGVVAFDSLSTWVASQL